MPRRVGKVRYAYKTKPRSYQRRGLKKVVNAERGALWWPMRSGKSKTAIDFASVLHLKYGIERVLVLTHSVTTLGVWRDQIDEHCPVPYTSAVRRPPTMPESGDLLDQPATLQFWIINIQNIFEREYFYKKDKDGNRVKTREWQPGPNKTIHRWRPEAVIIDEATILGDPSSVQTAHTYRLVQQCQIRFVLELTGTPVHRKIFGAFGQFKVLDDSVFGTSIVAYREEYGLWGGYGNKKLLRLRNVRRWRRKVEPHVHQVYRLPARPPVEQVIPLELDRRTRTLYTRLEKEGYIHVDDWEVTAELPIVRALKMAQLACGFIRDDAGRWHAVGKTVPEAFASHVQDLADSEVERLVVFARHIPELRAAALALKKSGYSTLLLHGQVSQEDRERRIAAFHDPGPPRAFVSQVSTGSMGIDLSAADTTLYYSLPTSLLHKDQADSRIRRHGDRRALTYYYFLPRSTMAETIYTALKEGMDLATYITKHPDLIHHLERE